MIYLKSSFAGIAAVILSFFLFSAGGVIYLRIMAAHLGSAHGVAWDPISVVSPRFLLVILAIFMTGFIWEFKRASR
jgi:hypothetical protein